MTTTTSPNTSHPARPEVPLAIWPVAQTTAQWQRAGRYLPGCARHPGKMLPELARRIVAEYSAPGDLVCDPLAGIGTTLAEAALMGRSAVGVELDERWVTLATDNLDHMLDGPSRRLAEIRKGDARQLHDVLGDLAGTVDLVVTSPPYGCDAGMIDKQAWIAGGRLCPADTLNYSTDKANLGHARGPAYEQAMADIYAACHGVLRPGGHLVVVTKNTRRKGRTLDLAGLTVALAIAAGFSYLGHVIALHAAIRDSDLVARPSYWQTTQIRHARAKGEPAHLVAHEDVTVFSRPATTREETADAR
ncbi:MAG: DNA methyltransferase [Actinomycetota bacterium]|jgi:DNA modification methylase|nr:DNA methyltransferase [Actinomycetota bacterium]